MSNETIKKPKRIPYDVWSNSVLSVAKFYGGCVVNGVKYTLDYDNCRTTGEGKDKRYYPDLVEVITTSRRKRNIKPPK